MKTDEIARRMGHIEIQHTFDVLKEAIRRHLDLKDKLPGHAWTVGQWLSKARRLNKGMMSTIVVSDKLWEGYIPVSYVPGTFLSMGADHVLRHGNRNRFIRCQIRSRRGKHWYTLEFESSSQRDNFVMYYDMKNMAFVDRSGKLISSWGTTDGKED